MAVLREFVFSGLTLYMREAFVDFNRSYQFKVYSAGSAVTLIRNYRFIFGDSNARLIQFQPGLKSHFSRSPTYQ